MQRLIVSLISLAMTFGGFAARVAGDTKAEQLLAQARAALGGERRRRRAAGAAQPARRHGALRAGVSADVAVRDAARVLLWRRGRSRRRQGGCRRRERAGQLCRTPVLRQEDASPADAVVSGR